MRIELLFDSIYYDVRQLTYRFAEPRYDTEKQAESKDLAQLGDNDSDRDLVLRFCYTGTAKLRYILKEYITKKTEDANDALNIKDKWGFNFTHEIMDSHGLAELMHWFVVRYALYEWARMFSANDAKAIKDDLDETKEELEDLLIDSTWPIKERKEIYEDIITI